MLRFFLSQEAANIRVSVCPGAPSEIQATPTFATTIVLNCDQMATSAIHPHRATTSRNLSIAPLLSAVGELTNFHMMHRGDTSIFNEWINKALASIWVRANACI